jgi:hypothetical protein
VSDSVPFLTVSLQAAAAHFLGVPVQTPSRQSAATTQLLFVPQSAQDTLPPQSVSVSTPFLVLSLHAGTWQTLPLQTPLAQSPLVLHAFKSAHFVLQDPPQSTSVSVPFFALSLQLLVVQRLLVHRPLRQSLPAVQAEPPAQRAQLDEPPQSMADSPPFLTLSLHAPVAHR